MYQSSFIIVSLKRVRPHVTNQIASHYHTLLKYLQLIVSKNVPSYNIFSFYFLRIYKLFIFLMMVFHLNF